MARKMTEWPSKRGPITKIMPSDGCIGDTVPLAVGKWYEFHEFGWHMGNVGVEFNILDYSSDKSITFEVPEEDIASALVEHCMRIKTPLPKKVEKELRVIDDHVCLDISIGDLGEAYGARGVLREILQKQAELVDEIRRLSGRFLGRDTSDEGASEAEKG